MRLISTRRGWSIQLINQQLISYRSLTSGAVTASAAVAAAAAGHGGDDDDDDDIADASVTDVFVIFTSRSPFIRSSPRRRPIAINRFAFRQADKQRTGSHRVTQSALVHLVRTCTLLNVFYCRTRVPHDTHSTISALLN